MDNKLGTSAAALLFLFPFAAQAQDGEASLTLAGGLAVAPAYEGSSFYSIEPLYQVNAGYQNASWGEFSAGSEGARWQFPLAGPVGIALLLNYDAGRDEEIRTLRGRN
ncbi:MAG: MipA/OmpV family protein, partial [Serratia marcescens]|nr:MipA/OmpV family protein [Serratia marcescens]